MYKIFVIEDDAVITAAMNKHLEKWGYQVELAEDFKNIMAQFAAFDPHLVLMDIGLPFYNGHYWCGQIRQISQIPIIFVSSAGDNMNIVMAINMGGDDFLVKPFELEVLSAKVQALLRRSYSFRGNTNIMEHNGVILDIANASLKITIDSITNPISDSSPGKEVREHHDEKLELTKNEFKILQLLFENVGKPVSRDLIMKRLWDNDCFVDDNTLTVNMTRIRKKLEEAGIKDFIQTRKGLGYMIGAASTA